LLKRIQSLHGQYLGHELLMFVAFDCQHLMHVEVLSLKLFAIQAFCDQQKSHHQLPKALLYYLKVSPLIVEESNSRANPSKVQQQNQKTKVLELLTSLGKHHYRSNE
jgi:hypothetical protein